MSLQVANFQRHELAFICPISKLVRVSDVHCHVCAASTCAFVYITVQYCIEWA